MHPIEAAMFVLLIKDSFNLYTYQSLVVFGILDRFQRWGKSTAAEALEFYNAFIVQNQRYKSWGFKASDAELIDKNLLPDFDNVPTKILDTLTLYLESGEILSDEENPKRLSEIMGVEKLIVNETKKKGKKKKKKKNAEVESSTDGDAEITPKNNSPPKVSHNARKSLDLLGFAAPTAKSKPAQVRT